MLYVKRLLHLVHELTCFVQSLMSSTLCRVLSSNVDSVVKARAYTSTTSSSFSNKIYLRSSVVSSIVQIQPLLYSRFIRLT